MSAIERSNRLFPTIGAIDEEQQIGRAAAIQQLRERVLGGRDSVLIEPRQVGKTSVVRAALQQSQRTGCRVAAADIKGDSATTSTQLAALLLKRASESEASGMFTLPKRARVLAGALGRKVAAPADALGAAAETLGVPAEQVGVGNAITDIFKRAGIVGLKDALNALEADAQLRQASTAVFLDEIQEVSEWGADGRAVQDYLAAAARRPGRRLRFVFAGSRTSALEKLFAHGQPLYPVCDRFALPAISSEDWKAGLEARMRDGGLQVEANALDTLLAASRGHPLCTMHAAKEAFVRARDEQGKVLELVHVEEGLAAAREQVWWEEYTSE